MPEKQDTTIPQTEGMSDGLELLPLDRLDRAVLGLVAKVEELRAAAAEHARHADLIEQQAADLERQLAIAEAKLAVETMHSAGLAAQASHLLAVAIEANVLAAPKLVGEGNGDQAPRTQLTLVYEAAFDAKGAELGIEDPSRFREA